MLVVVVVPSLACAASQLLEAWSGSNYGSCYASIEQGMADVYGAEYLSNVNIVRRAMTLGTSEIVVSEDRTTGTNSARTVFEKRAPKKWCVILTSPPVASLLPVTAKGVSGRPSQWITLTQAAPGYPETKVIYVWRKQDALFYPARCFYIFQRKVQRFNCSDAYKVR